MHLERTVPSQWDAPTTFAYLADFTTTNQWDPGTVSTTRITGEGGVGTTYRNVSRFRGKESELIYRVVALDAPRRIHLRGSNKTLTADDVITVTPDGARSQVHYSATFDFNGIARFVVPLLGKAFTELGDEAAAGMRTALSGPAPSGPAPSGPAPSGPAPSGPAPSGPAPSGAAPGTPPRASTDPPERDAPR